MAFRHILKNSKIGKRCTVGQNVMIGPDVIVGNGCQIRNNVSVFKGVTLEAHVFCGPSCVSANVLNPRSEISRMDELRPTSVRPGATIGAGAVVTKDAPAYALVHGNRAVQKGWMCRCGAGKLHFGDSSEATRGVCRQGDVKPDGDVAPR